MSLDGTLLGLEAFDDEGVDDEGVDDQESDDEQEGFFDALGTVLDPLGIRRIFSGPTRAPLPRVSTGPGAPGVASAQLNTPRGSATLQLPQPVVSKAEFNQTVGRLQAAINQDTSRINAIQGDIKNLTQRVGAAVADSKRDIQKVRREVVATRKANATALARLRRDQSSQASTNMLISFMMQRQIQDQVASHTHAQAHTHPLVGSATAAAGNEPALPPSSGSAGTSAGGSNSMLMLLPLLMMGSSSRDGGGGNDAMSMLPLLFMFGS
jgi:hypothetical protein